eukprot:s1635_g15.t1
MNFSWPLLVAAALLVEVQMATIEDEWEQFEKECLEERNSDAGQIVQLPNLQEKAKAKKKGGRPKGTTKAIMALRAEKQVELKKEMDLEAEAESHCLRSRAARAREARTNAAKAAADRAATPNDTPLSRVIDFRSPLSLDSSQQGSLDLDLDDKCSQGAHQDNAFDVSALAASWRERFQEVDKAVGQHAIEFVQGHDLLSFMGTSLQREMAKIVQGADAVADKLTRTSCDFHFTGHHCSAAAASKLLDIPVKVVRKNALLLGSSIRNCGGWLWGTVLSTMCENFASERWKPVLAIRRFRFDETPTGVRLCEEPDQDAIKFQSELQTHSKVMQTELTLAFLVQNMEKGGAEPEFFLLEGGVPCSLTAVDTTTGERILASNLLQLKNVPEYYRCISHFPMVVMHACTDGHGANYRAEKMFKSLHYKSQPDVRCHLGCDLHRAAICAKNLAKLVEDDVAGVLSVGLACAITGCAHKLRAHLRSIIAEELVILPREAPEGMQLHFRTEVMDLYLPHRSHGSGYKRDRCRRFILEKFLNGDWEHPTLQHYCPPGLCCPSREKTVEWISNYVTWALIPEKCPKYSRARWTNYDRALKWTGLLACCHRLLPRLLAMYAGQPLDSDSAELYQDAITPLPALAEARAFEPDEPAEAADMEAGPGAAAELAFSGHAELPVKGDGNEAGEQREDWVEFNRRQKANSLAWSKTRPERRLPLMLQVCEPLLELTYHFLTIGSADWEHGERLKAAQAQKRAYPVELAAHGEKVSSTLGKLGLLLAKPPMALPFASCNRQSRLLFFSMLSRAMCSLHLVLRAAHKGFPYKLFKAFQDSWGEILATPRCQHDELARAFLAQFHYSLDELDSPLSLALLESLAVEFSTDIGAIEAKHSKNRDISKLRASAWTPSLAFLSSKFMARQLAISRARKHRHRHSQAPRASRRSKKRASGKKSPGGGAWRAFLHEWLAGQRFTKAIIKDCAMEYWALSPEEEKARYKQLGLLGTIAKRHGHDSFGPRVRSKAVARPRPLPGGIDEVSGAIVLQDAERQEAQLLPLDHVLGACTAKPFPEDLKEFKEELNASIKANRLDKSG